MLYFDLITILNVPSATARWEQTVQELNRVGINGYTKFPAIQADNARESFNKSMIAMLAYIEASSAKNTLILEDDVMFTRHVPLLHNRLQCALKELPEDWDVLYLGANLYVEGFKMPENYSPSLKRVFNAWTTHAVAFSKKAATYLLDQNPPITDGMFDDFLSRNLKNLKSFCMSPMIAMQRPGKSLIWGHNVNYNDLFVQSNIILSQVR